MAGLSIVEHACLVTLGCRWNFPERFNVNSQGSLMVTDHIVPGSIYLLLVTGGPLVESPVHRPKLQQFGMAYVVDAGSKGN